MIVRTVQAQATVKELEVKSNLSLRGHLRTQATTTQRCGCLEGVHTVEREQNSVRVVGRRGKSLNERRVGQINAGVVTCHTISGTQFTERQNVVLRNKLCEDPACGDTRIEVAVLCQRQCGRPVVTSSEVDEQLVGIAKRNVTEHADRATFGLTLSDVILVGAVAQIPETGLESQLAGLCLQIRVGTLADVHTGYDVQVELAPLVLIRSQNVVVELVLTTITSPNATGLVH